MKKTRDEGKIEQLDDEIEKWLQLLITVIDFRFKSASDCCKLFFNQDLFCCNHFEEFIRLEVSKI